MTTSKDTIIVGAGLSGLVVAHTLKLAQPDHRLILLEKAPAAGGAIRSSGKDGFLAEIGPHGFLDNCAESRELLSETGLDRESVAAPLAQFVRYVCIGGSLKMIPQSPLKILAAPLIAVKDKLRVAGELFREPLTGEPTVAKWAEYRFGRALLPYVDAVFTGTYAGDYNELKIDAVMPGVRALEQQYGSVLRGGLAKFRAARKEKGGGKRGLPAMTSFPGGMQRLPEKLAERFTAGSDLLLEHPVTRLQQIDGGWLAETTAETFTAGNLVLALPVNPALRLLQGIDSSMPLAAIPEAWLATVVLGFKGAQLPPGFGFLTPEVERRFSLGTLFSSNMFPGRAPEGHILIETLVGGRRHPERLDYSDEELIRRSLADVGPLLGLTGAPAHGRVLRPQAGIPQLEAGYPALLAWRNALVDRNPGLFVCGFGWEGIGINDMIKAARLIARKLGTGSRQHSEPVEAKKIYF